MDGVVCVYLGRRLVSMPMNNRLVQLSIVAVLLAGCAKPAGEEVKSTRVDGPVVEEKFQISKDWSVNLPGKFNRRIEEDGCLVLWRPGMTIWTIVWDNDRGETAEERLAQLKSQSSPEAYAQETERDGAILRYAYRLDEQSDDKRRPAFYGFAIGRNGHVQMAIYFDDEADLATAKQIWRSLAE